MKKILSSFVIAATCLSGSFAQNTGRIQKAYAFYTMSIPGMIMRDDNGNEVRPVPSFERTIYIECAGTKMPVLNTVLYNKTVYTPTLAAVDDMPVIVGKRYGDGQAITLRPKKGDRLWKLTLAAENGQGILQQDVTHILIKARAGNRAYTFPLFSETRLMAPERY